MRTKKTLALTIAVFSAFAFLASVQAEAADNYYVSGHVGGSWFGGSESTGGGLSIENDFDMGYALAGAIGYRFGNGFRAEGEISYRQADIDTFNSVSAGGTSITLGDGLAGDGDVSAFGFMANGAYDFNTGNAFTPYLMGGLGFANVSVNNAKVVNVLLADDSDVVFAYQIGAGVSYRFSDKMSVDASYRFMGTADPKFTDSAGGEFESELTTHTVMIGLRYDF